MSDVPIAAELEAPFRRNLQIPISANRLRKFAINVVPLAIVLLATLYSIWTMTRDTLFLPWPGNPDEFPYVQEVLRFIGLDFRQQFFDIPGTPLMFLAAALWSVGYWVFAVLGRPSTTVGLTEFSFQHMQALFVLVRVLVLALNAVSIVSLYFLTRRLTNTAGACVAALLLTFSWLYSQSAWYIRIEPLAVVLVIASLYLWLLAHDSGRNRYYLLAGAAAGLAMAARFPVLLATLPVLIVWHLVSPPSTSGQKSRRSSRLLLWTLAISALLGGSIVLSLRAGVVHSSGLTNVMMVTVDAADGDYSFATRLISNVWLALAVVALAWMVTSVLPLTRPAVDRLSEPRIALVLGGFVAGVLVGTPTLIWSGRFLLRSIDLFIQRNAFGATGQPLYVDFAQMVAMYWGGVVRTPLDGVLLVLGAILGIALKDKRLWPFIFGAFIGIVSQGGKLQSERHLIPWLPYFYVLMSYPVAVAARSLGREASLRRVGQTAVFVAATAAVMLMYGWIPGQAAGQSSSAHIVKSGLQVQVNQWLLANTPPGSTIFHVCCDTFNDQVILDWMRQDGLSIPDSVRTSGVDRVWFGDKQPLLEAGAGYAVIASQYYKGFYIDYYNKLDPSRMVDPMTDPHFRLMVEYPSDTYSPLAIYRFDFRDTAAQ